MDTMNKPDFIFSVPVEIDLSKSVDSEDASEWRIRGYASNSADDRQGESIVQKGLDVSDFLEHGWFNFDHDNTKILGYPDSGKCHMDSKGFYVEGTLLKGVPLARDMWNLAVQLQKSNSPRRLGFSVEGKVLEKSLTGKILKAKVYNVAITPNPVNATATFEALCKSFAGKDELDKAMEAGYGATIGADSNGATIGADSNGAAVIPESLEKNLRCLAEMVGSLDFGRLRDELIASTDVTPQMIVIYLQLVKGLSRDEAVELVNAYNFSFD